MTTPMERKGSDFLFTSTKCFNSEFGILKLDHIQRSFQFAYEMAFGSGYHRAKQFGGNVNRKPGEIFANAFQGKLAEFAFYDHLTSLAIPVSLPDTEILGRGSWDDADFVVQGKKIAIKSTKYYGHLLMLEESMWTPNGDFKHDNSYGQSTSYDYFVLTRLVLEVEKIMKRNHQLYSTSIDFNTLWGYFQGLSNDSWKYDIPGFVSLPTVQQAIQSNQIILQNQTLNQRTTISVDNYYIQSGDLIDIHRLFTP